MDNFDFSLLGKRVLCAVSGGADSVYMLHRCLEASGSCGCAVLAAHYNHCLRGEESDRDERFVRELCAGLGVECAFGRGDVAAYALEHGMGTEEAARTMRYAFLEDAASRLGADTIATAHNADDNAETMLLALVRGSGIRGLAGIPPRRGNIVRPMLGVTRAEIEEYLKARGLKHVEDSTNKSLEYSRNRLRALVMPVLREINPEFVAAAGRASRLLRADEECLEAMARDFLAGFPGEKVSCAALTALDRSLASRAVRLMCPRPLEFGHVEAVLAAARDGNASADVPGGRFRAERGVLSFGPAGSAALPERELAIPGLTPVPECGIILEAEFTENVCEIHTSLNTFCFQYESICGTICCTARRPGDRMKPAGRGCTKKLANLFAEKGVPASRRELIPVLRDGRGVLAAVGFGQDERSAAKPGGRALVVRVRKAD